MYATLLLEYVKHMQDNFDHYAPALVTDEHEATYSWNTSEAYEDEVEHIKQLRLPLRDKIDTAFSGHINDDGIYTGSTSFTFLDGNSQKVCGTVGPGESDGFGWLTGRVRLVYQLNGKLMYDQIIFG